MRAIHFQFRYFMQNGFLKLPPCPFLRLKGILICRCYRSTITSLLLSEKINTNNQFNQILALAISSGCFAQDPFVSSKLLLRAISFSDDEHQLAFPRTLFFRIPNPNIFAWNFMFKAYSHCPSPHECLRLYNLMRRQYAILPDNYSFSFLLKACATLKFSLKGQELHSLVLRQGYELDVFVQNSLINMYFQCHMVERACRVFDMIPDSVRDVISWNTMVSGYLQNDRCGGALNVLVEMLSEGSLRPDASTLVSSLTACGRIASLDLGRTIHGLLITNGFVLDVFSGTSLVDMYTKCGQVDEAMKVFVRIPIPERNVVCWTSLIVGFVKLNFFKEAIQLFKDMLVDGVMADSEIAACVVSACGHSGALDQGVWVHTFCERNGIGVSLSFKNALIDMYSKCGNVERALEIFQTMTQTDVYSWTAMISGLALNGKCNKAVRLFSKMVTYVDVRPNEVTFLGVLSACCHGGFVAKGLQYFKIMMQIYALTPRIEHYGCIVDLLGRANLLGEAENFIRAMPIQPDVVIWRSLLFACRSNENVALAELAMKNIEELEADKCSARLLLSNTYASALRWYEAHKTRKYVSRQRIQKEKQPGCSLIEIDGVLHEFFAADHSHYQNIFVPGADSIVR